MHKNAEAKPYLEIDCAISLQRKEYCGAANSLVLLATMVTVIASQAVISGAFSLTQQAMQLGEVGRQTGAADMLEHADRGDLVERLALG